MKSQIDGFFFHPQAFNVFVCVCVHINVQTMEGDKLEERLQQRLKGGI